MAPTREELTVPQVAEILKLSEETIRRHIRAHRLRARKLGIQWFISRRDLTAFANLYQSKFGHRLG